MRTFCYISWLLFTSTILNAQDTLYKMDGTRPIVKIIEINASQVKYKLTSNPEGPTYVISREEVIKVVYENGIIDVFPKVKPSYGLPERKLDPRVTDYGRNFIAINVLDLLQGSLTVSYEYIFKSGRSAIKIPLSFRFAGRGYAYSSKVFGTGVDYNLYPYGQGQIKFFYGPALEYKQFKSDYDFDPTSQVALLFQGGFLYQPSKHFNMSINLGAGYARTITRSYNYAVIVGRIGLNMGYKF